MNSNTKSMSALTIVSILATTATGLVAGLMYSYACSVNPGLARVSDHEFVGAMQAINRAIQNPVFFASFMGTLILLPVNAWMSYGKISSQSFILLLSAAIIYVVGVFGVTMFGNVPLNEALDKFNLNAASAEEITRQRLAFSIPWNKLHNVRTFFSVVAFVLVIVSLITRDKGLDRL